MLSQDFAERDNEPSAQRGDGAGELADTFAEVLDELGRLDVLPRGARRRLAVEAQGRRGSPGENLLGVGRAALGDLAAAGACELDLVLLRHLPPASVDLPAKVCSNALELLEEPHLGRWDNEAEDEQLEARIRRRPGRMHAGSISIPVVEIAGS